MRRGLMVLGCSLAMGIGNTLAIDYVVEGKVEGLDGKMLYMHDYDSRTNIDSTAVMNGSFRFKGSYDRQAFVRIENGNVFSNCILDTLAVVDFTTHRPSDGSGLNKKLIEYMSESQKIDDELAQFGNELRGHGFEQPEFGEIYKLLYDKLRPGRLKLQYKTIAENSNGLGEAAIMGLGSDWMLTPDEWDAAYSTMSPYLRERRVATYYNDMFANLRNSQPGKPFIDLNAKTPDGRDVRLSDYLGKGKYVLVDFWASWCGPCRDEAEETLRPLYEKYKGDERFMILGVATWDEHDNTVAALEKLNYPWPQIIDAGQTPMKLYGFNAIPMLFLIGPDGTILERELRGESLVNAVDSVLNRPDGQ